jgi:hypothetical protein
MILELAVTALALGGGYGWAKRFVTRKLRFVDAVHTRPAPWIAGASAALIATPFTLLPIITGVTALALGAGVGLGVRAGQKTRYLPPGEES